MMSFVAETFIFLYVGMDAVDIEKWKMSKLKYYFLNEFNPNPILLSENFFFASFQMCTFGCSLRTSLVICSTLILIISLARAAFVFPLSVLSNYTNRARHETGSKITFKHMVSDNIYKSFLQIITTLISSSSFFLQITIWWAGLMRGAVSIALAFEQVCVYNSIQILYLHFVEEFSLID